MVTTSDKQRRPIGTGVVPEPAMSGWKRQQRVVGALIMREVNARYGRENIGVLWMIGEPMMLATVITLAHVVQPSHYGSDIQPAPFAIIGYSIFIIFRGVFNRAEGAIEYSQPLLYHRQVAILDILIARAIPEVIGCFSTMVILLTIGILFGMAGFPVRPLHLLAAAALMAWWSIALSLIAAALSYRNETLGRQLHVFSYFTIPISGAFFMLGWLPLSFRSVLAWNPMCLIFEEARYGQFRSASPDFVDPGYVIAWCAGLTLFGLAVVRRTRSLVHG